MTPIDIQVSSVSVEGQAYFLYAGKWGIHVLQTSIFRKHISVNKFQMY